MTGERRNSKRRRSSARWMSTLGTILLLMAMPLFRVSTASASSVVSASFSGGAGTVVAGGTLYARQGGALTLTVSTSADTKCVTVTGAFSTQQTSGTAKSSWSFSFTAGSGDGTQMVTVAARPNFNSNACTGAAGTASASFVLDNTGPTVTGTLVPAPNGAGWNNSNVTINWSAVDAGSGVASGPTPSSDSVTSNTSGVTKTATAVDRLGNSGSGSVTVKLDKDAPTIAAQQSPAPNSHGWNNTNVTVSFNCVDALSGIKSCTGPATFTHNGANQSAAGTAVDNADNSASTSVTVNIDKAPPTLSGSPTTSPNGAGWYNSNVTIHWTCTDAFSGIDGSCPSDSTIASEGTGLTATTSVSDLAGNTTTATSSPAVQIDKTPPNTTATAPANWNNTDVTVSLNASDALSGVAATHYILDGGAQQSGTSLTISAEGTHTLQFWSVDNAGNTEPTKSVTIKIDKTPPTINHTQAPPANGHGWNNSDVTVIFTCADPLNASNNTAGSGIATCDGVAGTTGSTTVSTEGQNQPVTGTALDNAGNLATDPATVSIDKTPPSISASPDRAANGNGWYKADVTVSFLCGDGLSGIAVCPDPQTLSEGANQTASGTAIDAADNTAGTSLTGINVDETPPSISGAPTTASNANGWYNSDVTVHWTCSDVLSGIDGSCPADYTFTGAVEGNNLSTSATITDLAGNSASATVSGIQIDRTPPSTLASVPAPFPIGWYAGPVQVTLNASDSLSGVAATYYRIDGGPAQSYTGPFNDNLSGIHTITFWSVDNADNTEDVTAPGHEITLKIDNVPPTISGSAAPSANGNGWNNSPVTVSFVCADADSGLASCTDPVTLTGEGAGQSVPGQAVDNVGNTASATVDHINIDLTPPALSGVPTMPANGFGWYNHDVTIQWVGQDGLSGIDTSTQPANSVISGEGSNLGAGPVSIFDLAGNSASTSVSGIKIDRTAPTITGAPTTSANANGWYSGPVTIHYNCGDALSGIAVCPGDDVLTGNGANQSISETAYDKAGNTASVTVSGINIDTVKPTVTVGGVASGAVYTLGAVPTATCSASDSLSGLAGPCSISVTGGLSNGVGTFTFTATATDLAGNTQTVTGTYRVIYKFGGFLQPVNDTGRPTACGSPCTASVFKGGSTIPVKFQLMRADGSIVQTNSAPLWLTPQKGAATSLGVDENVYSDSASSGTTYRWDSTAQQYIYNASTKGMATGYFWRLYVQLDDGQTYSVDVALR
jgi:hypothetical protein